LTARKKAVVAQLKELQTACEPILIILRDEKLVSDLRNEKAFTLEYLQGKFNVIPEVLESLYKLAKLHYEIGTYEQAANYLGVYRQLATDSDRSFGSLWGHFASLILLQKWEEAFKDFKDLQSAIDTKVENCFFSCLFLVFIFFRYFRKCRISDLH
jgi:translation initiation factor 3 subunit E